MLKIITEKNVPKVLLRYMMMKFLDLKTIKKIVRNIPGLSVFDNYSKEFLEKVYMGLEYNCSKGNMNIAKWMFDHCYAGQIDDLNIQYFANAFLAACKHGHLDVAQWLFSIAAHRYNRQQAFELSCKKGHIDIAKWLYSVCAIKISREGDKSFMNACYNNRLDVAQWLYSICDIHISSYFICLFDYALEKGYLEMARWLLGTKGVKKTRAFVIACKHCYIDMAKEIAYDGKYTTIIDPKLDIHRFKEQSFIYACGNGHLDIAKWLLETFNVDIYAQDAKSIKSACMHGHLPMVKWLYRKGMDIHLYNEYSFKLACKYGQLDVAKWLWSKMCNVKKKYFNLDNRFLQACYKGRLDVAQWLYSIGDINIHVKDNSAIKRACIDGHLDVVKWLCTLTDFGSILAQVAQKSHFRVWKWFKINYKK